MLKKSKVVSLSEPCHFSKSTLTSQTFTSEVEQTRSVMAVKVQSDAVQGGVGRGWRSRIPLQLAGGRGEALLVAVAVRREAAVAAAPVVAVGGEAVEGAGGKSNA